MSAENPFNISVSDDALTRLQAKLDASTFPDELENVGWTYGVPLADIRRLVARWKQGFDWKQIEKALNDELPQFTTNIEVDGFQTLNVHFVHKKSEAANAIPLLFVHGWPGSFIEVRKVLPLLVANTPEHPSFNVVAVSLPGFTFSEAPRKKGFGPLQYAEVGHKLMLVLGYSEYVTHGGDWGYTVTRKIAQVYGGKHSKAWHTTVGIGRPPHLTKNPILYLSHLLTPYTPAEKAGIKYTTNFQTKGQGYFNEHSTQPQTIGYSLADSPVGLLAWIYEKLISWTDEYPWTDDEVLTWISLYWFSRAGPAASVRIYYEAVNGGAFDLGTPPSIPMGVSFFPKELWNLPRVWVRTTGNVVLIGEHDRGGHFATVEKPAEVVADIRKMFGREGPAFGVVSRKAGYAKL